MHQVIDWLTQPTSSLTFYEQSRRVSEDESTNSEDSADIVEPVEKMTLSAGAGGMQSLIPVVNDLQNVFQTAGMDVINLPQIVVIGSQSCGKTSVLESLMRKSFLPRGTGIVTRCPIVLQLIHSDDEESEEYCEFRGKDRVEGTYTDFEEVRKQIEDRTTAIAGNNKGISDTPIVLRFFSPKVVNLTLVDLPGITKNPVGDQPENIEDQVRSLILNKIANPHAIILAVSSATEDIANSESIKLAKAVDPEGVRTLGVLTKLDLMEKGTNASAVLDGKIIKINLGMVGVVNRSTADVKSNKSLMAAVKDENEYLRRYYSKHGDKIGTTYLGDRLNKLLMEHIAGSLPEVSNRIAELKDETEKKLIALGPEVECNMTKLHTMLKITNEFLNDMESAVKQRRTVKSSKDGNFGVKIADTFDLFDQKMDQHIFLENLDSRVQLAMRESTDFQRFPSMEVAFMTIVKEEIIKMEEPAILCAKSIHGTLSRLADSLLKKNRFEPLKTEMRKAVRRSLDEQLKETIDAMKQQLQIEANTICTSDKKFRKILSSGCLDGMEAMDDVEEAEDAVGHEDWIINNRRVERVAFGIVNSARGDQCKYVEKVISTYFDIVKSRFTDLAPKFIMFHLYECSRNEKIPLAINKATESKVEELMREPETVRRERVETGRLLQNLKAASDIIGDILMKTEEADYETIY